MTPERREWRRSGVFIVNFEQIYTVFWCFHFDPVGMDKYLFKVNNKNTRTTFMNNLVSLLRLFKYLLNWLFRSSDIIETGACHHPT